MARKQRRVKRQVRVKKKVRGSESRPRLAVFRSSKHIYAQIIDDQEAKTIASANSLTLNGSAKKAKGSKKSKKYKGKTGTAYEVGATIAKVAIKKKVKEVVFDRGGYRFHGRVAALAEGARKGGLKF